MCIIVAKPAGVAIPSEKTFESCFTSNKDGIGISYARQGERPVIHKGFANVKKLMRVLDISNITPEHNLVVHFRFATHGKKDQGNCHPFPLCSSFEDMRLLHCSADCTIAHNGVFSGMPQSEKFSDTMKFIGGILSSNEVMQNLDSKSVKELIRGYCGFGSKLAFLRESGISLVGDYQEEAGVYYSNHQYKTYNYSGHNHNNHNHNHNEWDKNHEGKEWCITHKKYDDCQWCTKHSDFDECHIDRIKKWRERFGTLHQDDTPLLLKGCCSQLPKKNEKNEWGLECDLCQTTEGDIRWSNNEQGFMCPDCMTLMANQYKDGD